VPWAILDANAYVDRWNGVLPASRFEEVGQTFIIRYSSVVLSELRRGAQTPAARRVVEALFRLAKVQWAPLADDWWNAGRIIERVARAHSWDRNRRRDFQNDALIALTARRYGATVVTSNREDFELLRREVRISVLLL
jgi:predicted nucleic acid-binding protein